MSTIAGTIRSASLQSKAMEGAGTTTRDRMEVWLVTADFAAYTGSTDDASLAAVGAAISARARDGATRTLLWGAPAFCGADANNQAVNFCGTSVAALTISTDDFTGELCTVNTVSTEVTATSGVTYGVGILVGVAVTVTSN
jgi:hypothetical protein